jgi:NAD(P)-dependent dehydrogenase (short-subunit alcohol dehydrogenase family)
MTEKVVLVTGGGSGIGLAIAQKFISNHCTVIITGRNKEKLDDARKLLGKKCMAKQFDMDWLDRMESFVHEISSELGPIDVLVNNAGINHKKPLTEVTDEDYERVIKTNQTALFALTREVVKNMLQHQTKGAIVHISSMTAHYGIPKVIAYTASKTAIEGMTRAMAVELSPMGIRINCVAPGFIKTAMSSKALDNDPDRKNRVLMRTPSGILGRPEDVANAVYFLASDEAYFITGEVLKVDGGNSIGF